VKHRKTEPEADEWDGNTSLKDGAQSGSQLAVVLTVIAGFVALASVTAQVLWLTHTQFSNCAIEIANRRQAGFCVYVPALNWLFGFGPVISVVTSLVILVRRRQPWHSSPIAPVVVFWLSVALLWNAAFWLVMSKVLSHT
jgi:hypothetical protein